MLKVIFNNLPKPALKAVDAKNNQTYYFKDADEILGKLQEYSQQLKEKDKSHLNLNFKLVNNEGALAYSMEDYILDGRDLTFKELIRHDLETKHLDEEVYDSGLSDPEEEKQALLKEIDESYNVETHETDVAVKTGSKPNLFKRILNRRKNSSEETEHEEMEENDIYNQSENAIREVIGQNLEQKSDISRQDVISSDVSEMESIKKEPIENHAEVVSEERFVAPKMTEPEPVKIEKDVEKSQTGEFNVTDKHEESFIPQIDYDVLIVEKEDITDVVSNDIREWLVVKEYERVNVTNAEIRKMNEAIRNHYMSIKEDNDRKVAEYDADTNNEVTFMEELDTKIESRNQMMLDKYEQEQKDYYGRLNSAKKTEIENEIKHYTQKLENEYKQYLLSNDKNLADEIELKANELRQQGSNARKVKQKEYKENHQRQVENYRKELNAELVKSTQNLYESIRQKPLLDVIRFNETIDKELNAIREKAKHHHLQVEKEKTEQTREQSRYLELKNEEQQLRLKQNEQSELENKKKMVELEKEKVLADIAERKLKLEEDKEQNNHAARMKEIELKYNNKPVVESRPIIQEKKSNKYWLAAPLSVLLLGGGVFGGMAAEKYSTHDDYNQLLKNADYEKIAETHPEKLNDLSSELYRDNKADALKDLADHTDNKIVDLRDALLKRNDKATLNVFESLNDYAGLSDGELKSIANIYLQQNKLEDARKIADTINDVTIKRSIEEINILTERKKELEKVIADKETGSTERADAKKELKRIENILQK